MCLFLPFSGAHLSSTHGKGTQRWAVCKWFAAIVLEATVSSSGHVQQEFSVSHSCWVLNSLTTGSYFFAKVRCSSSAGRKHFSLLSGRPCFLVSPECLPFHLTSNLRKNDILPHNFWSVSHSSYREPMCLILDHVSLYRLSIKNPDVVILQIPYTFF